MQYRIQAACGCHMGKIRKNNEDNFYFNGILLERENNGLDRPLCVETKLRQRLILSVFDGMGGENFGEYASFAAAQQMVQARRRLVDVFIPTKTYLLNLVNQLNEAVLKVQQELCAERMGSTMVSFFFVGRYIYTCNLGDSRAYRLRNGELLQLSVDHILKCPGREHKKAPLTQYLGINTEDMLIEPHIEKNVLQRGDMFLLCSDGLTDMLAESEIRDIMLQSHDAEDCVQTLIRAALEHGGRDNTTVVVCRSKERKRPYGGIT